MNKHYNCAISIIVPAYNAESFLRICLDSILKQTFTDFEVIVVDDGSIDNTKLIIREYQELDYRILGIYKENGGVTSARNAGVQFSKGKYLFFLDSDDYIPSSALNDLFQVAENESSDIVFGLFALIENQKCKIYHVNDFGQISKLEYLKLLCTGRAPWQLCSKLFRRELYQVENLMIPQSLAVGEDALALFQLVLHAQKISMVNKTVYYYVQRSNSVMHTKNIKLANDNFIAANSIVHILDKDCSGLELPLYGIALRMLFLLMAFQQGGMKVDRELVCPLLKDYTDYLNVMGLFSWKKRIKIQLVISLYKWF